MRIILASASPRRRELLLAAGLTFDVVVSDVDERRLEGEAPGAYASRVARDKAQAVAATSPHRAVLAADTIVVVGGDVLGKPVDDMDARRMLERLSGQPHEVLTAVALASSNTLRERLERTRVWIRPLTAAEVTWYVASGEPRDKAGAYAIQGLASRFVERIDGSYSNVVGLPVEAVIRLLAEAGIECD